MMGTLPREGMKVKHLKVRLLWLQGHIASNSVILFKGTSRTGADAPSHCWSNVDGGKHLPMNLSDLSACCEREHVAE